MMSHKLTVFFSKIISENRVFELYARLDVVLLVPPGGQFVKWRLPRPKSIKESIESESPVKSPKKHYKHLWWFIRVGISR